ncbi:MAG: twin transmembrane helix small protein [Alphaproteobacteria bacterium]|nr:twin transmembrane helix small protein [Alphaproteobacteria bacterium]
MSGLLSFLIALALGAVLVALFVGIIGFAAGGEFNRRHGNTMMRLRVAAQAAAVLLLAAALLTGN